MATRSSIRKRLSTTALFAALSAGMAAQAKADFALGTHDYWTSFVQNVDGQAVCGVRTSMSRGGKLGLMVVAGQVQLVAYDPSWSLTPGNVSDTVIRVDGNGFRGEAKVVDSHTLMITDLSRSFIEQFVDGSDMLADFGGGRWDISLIGSSGAAQDMVSCAAIARASTLS